MPTDSVDIPSPHEPSGMPPDPAAHDAGPVAGTPRQVARRRNDAERQRTNENKLNKRLLRETARAIHDFNMIEDGDKLMVCLSGGKDSYSLLDLLLTLKQRAPIHFDIIAVNLDQKQPGFPAHVLPDYLRERGVPFHIETRDTYSVVTRLIPEGKTMCSLCSRLRRGNLYRVASELGATKIALGHHRDDILGTFFLNLFYGGRMKAMSPKLMSDDGRHIIIRPMAYVAEKDLIAYSELKQFPIIPCNLCGSQENLKRKEVTRMIAEWDKKFPGRSWNVFGALSKVVGSHLMDRELFDFENLRATGAADENGDKAFDEENFPDLPSAVDGNTGDGAGEDGAERFAPTVVARTVKPSTSGE